MPELRDLFQEGANIDTMTKGQAEALMQRLVEEHGFGRFVVEGPELEAMAANHLLGAIAARLVQLGDVVGPLPDETLLLPVGLDPSALASQVKR